MVYLTTLGDRCEAVVLGGATRWCRAAVNDSEEWSRSKCVCVCTFFFSVPPRFFFLPGCLALSSSPHTSCACRRILCCCVTVVVVYRVCVRAFSLHVAAIMTVPP